MTSDLRPEQCSAVREVFRAMLRPHLELPIVCGQRFDVLVAVRRGRQGRTMLHGKARHKNGIQPFRTVTVKSTAAVLLWTRSRVRLHSRRRKSAPAICESSTSILRTPNPGSLQTAARFDAHQILRGQRTRILGSSRAASGSMRAGSRSHRLQNRSGSSAQTRDHFRPRVVPLKAGRRPRAGSC